MPNFKPLADYLLIKVSKDTQSGGITVIAEGDRGTLKKGTVIEVGPNRVESFGLMETKTKKGDTVYYPEAAEQTIRLEDGPYSLVQESACVGFERPDAPKE